jgi:hypothetical protein
MEISPMRHPRPAEAVFQTELLPFPLDPSILVKIIFVVNSYHASKKFFVLPNYPFIEPKTHSMDRR